MSIYRTQLKGITTSFLIKAINDFIKTQEGMRIDNNYYARGEKFDIAVVSRLLPRGMAFSIERGCLVIKGDAWNQEEEFERLRNLIPQFIKAKVVAATTRAAHPNAKMQMKTTQHEVILEVCI